MQSTTTLTIDQTALVPDIELSPMDSATPRAVLETVEFCRSRNIWALLSRNRSVSSCREAALSRYRLGNVGIPLCDEFKSMMVEVRSSDERSFVLIHCRADRTVDFKLLSGINLSFSELERTNLSTSDFQDFGYGLVNPFRAEAVIAPRSKLTHIFDEGLFGRSSSIDTMMTNAGDRTWGIEFRPADLLAAIPDGRKVVAKVTVEEDIADRKQLPGIGIITGNAPESGMLLWDKVNARHRRWLGTDFKGDLSYPLVTVYSVPEMGLTMELAARERPVWEMLERKVDTMIAAGVRVLSVACNTTQYFGDRLDHKMHSAGGTFVSAAPSVKRYIEAQAPANVQLLGIGYSASLGRWSGYRELSELPNLLLPDESQQEELSSLAYFVKTFGPTPQAHQKLRMVLRRARARSFLLLLTELSIIYSRYPRSSKRDVEIVDALDLYADAIHHEAVRNAAR